MASDAEIISEEWLNSRKLVLLNDGAFMSPNSQSPKNLSYGSRLPCDTCYKCDDFKLLYLGAHK